MQWIHGQATNNDDKYSVIDDMILYKNRIYLVPSSHLKELILGAVHNVALASHSSIYKTYRIYEWSPKIC